ncbi:MAG: nitrogen regulation protein NR(II) [Gammaproteobacteria bacterium]|nr:nitrogen regulation protein NR(II) [Gammaproteobacteria bacterium]
MRQEQQILDYLSTGVVELDSNLNVTALNAASQALLETSEARCVGQHASKLILQPRDWLDKLEQALANNSPHASRDMCLMLLSGQDVRVDVIITPITGDKRQPSLIVELIEIDRLMKISRDESLMYSHETSRAVIRGLAHEIKNPLGGVRGAAQLLARELPDSSLTEYTGIIISEADRLRDLVDRLLGPKQQLNPLPLNIHEVLEHVQDLITAESDNQVRIERDYDPSLPEFPGDRAQLIQAVLNVMRNAVQAADEPGSCEITLRTRCQRQFTMGARRHRLVCAIDIIDNGPGVPEEMQHTIFAPMVTGRADGTGLGLSIAQSVVSQHGGLLTCDSIPGKTTFTIYLPMDNEHAKAT